MIEMKKAFSYIDLSYMDLMSDGDPEMKKVMLDMLLSELPEEVASLKVLFQDNNIEDLGKLSHKMKSTLAFVGNPEMTEANKELELVCKQHTELDKIPELINTIDASFQKVIVELKLVFESL